MTFYEERARDIQMRLFYLERHIRKRARKLRRWSGPLIKRLERARIKLEER